ncbi:MAG: helix-turn-helix domain-containing protein [Lachnospiraceae bacterium]|nr:helix-turn-helix domain-containing protein [Lachnospiraceae bacterium]
MDVNMEVIGKRIKETRLQKNLKHLDIYKQCGIASGAMSMIENGKRVPSAIILYHIAKVLNVSVDWLITGESTNSKDPIFYGLEDRLLKSFRELDTDDQEEVIEFIQMKVMLSNRKKQTAKSSKLPSTENTNMVS